MRLLDLFESAVVLNVNEDKTPITIKATERFKKEAQKFARGFPLFKSNLQRFLTLKSQNPAEKVNKKDTPRLYNVPNLDWGHSHIIYGQAILWYKFFGNTLVLASVTDHTPLNIIPFPAGFSNYLLSINPSDTTDINVNVSDQPPNTDNTTEPQAIFTPQYKTNMPLESRIEIWTQFFIEMAKSFRDREILEKFAEQSDDENFKEKYKIFLNTFNLYDYWIDTSSQIELARNILADISLPLEEVEEFLDVGESLENIAIHYKCSPDDIQKAILKYNLAG